jgi:AraC-like DNA-binding protein
MDAEKNETLNIEWVAREAMLSSSHFFRSFKKSYGISPYQYFFQKKMRRAAHLLCKRNMTATEVALECGFPDLASFSKAFKKVYQKSPKQFLQTVAA